MNVRILKTNVTIKNCNTCIWMVQMKKKPTIHLLFLFVHSKYVTTFNFFCVYQKIEIGEYQPGLEPSTSRLPCLHLISIIMPRALNPGDHLPISI